MPDGTSNSGEQSIYWTGHTAYGFYYNSPYITLVGASSTLDLGNGQFLSHSNGSASGVNFGKSSGGGGLYFSNATTGLSCGGTECLRATTTGVKLGAASNPTQALDVTGNGLFTGTLTASVGGAPTAVVSVGGLLNTLVVSSGMAAGSAAETTLYTYTLPANTLLSTATLASQVLQIYGAGTTATAAALEEIRVYWGGTVIMDSGAANLGTSNWSVKCDVIQRTTGSSQYATCFFEAGTAVLSTSNGATAIDITANQIVKITGQVSVATANGVKIDNAYVEKK